MERLDNPVWASLVSRHAALGTVLERVGRYSPDVAPFAAAASAEADIVAGLDQLAGSGESVLFVGPCPPLPTSWQRSSPVAIAQMLCDAPVASGHGPALVELTGPHLPDMLALTALVYPHYFRPRTPEMGRYIGIYDGDVLAAMAGERMGFDGFQEISAVCTHPEYTGRGMAYSLVAALANASLAAGRLPFLHVAHENSRAKALYERMGFRHRRDIDLCSVTRMA